MTTAMNVETATAPAAVEAIQVPKVLWLLAFAAMVISYLMFSENGAVLTQQWEVLHEVFHDGRHVFGVPCH